MSKSLSTSSNSGSQHQNPVRPYNNARQQFVVVQLCHEQLQIRSQHPGTRILGFFGTKALADRAVHDMRRDGITDDTVVYPVKEALLCCKSRQRLVDNEYRKEKVSALIKTRNAWLQMREDELEERRTRERDMAEAEQEIRKKRQEAKAETVAVSDVADGVDGDDGDDGDGGDGGNRGGDSGDVDGEDVHPSQRTVRGKIDSELHNKYKNPYRNREGRTALGKTTTRAKALARVRKQERAKTLADKQEHTEVPFPRNLEVRDQDYAVFAYIDDVSKEAGKQDAFEPVFWYFGAFATEAEATDWMTRSAAAHVKDPPMMVVRMYEWLYPTAVDTSRIKEIYENEEVGTIIGAWKQHENLLDDFIARCKDKGLPIPASGYKPEQYEQMVQEKGIINVRGYDGDDDPARTGERVVAAVNLDPDTGAVVDDVKIYEGPHRNADYVPTDWVDKLT